MSSFTIAYELPYTQEVNDVINRENAFLNQTKIYFYCYCYFYYFSLNIKFPSLILYANHSNHIFVT